MRSFQENFLEFVKDSRKCNLLFDYSIPVSPYELLRNIHKFPRNLEPCVVIVYHVHLKKIQI